jgi:hypothetical protein
MLELSERGQRVLVEEQVMETSLDEEGTVALPLDSLLAVAGGLLGGALTIGCLWCGTWALIGRRSHRQP